MALTSLTWADVEDIRSRRIIHGDKRKIAEEFGVSPGLISQILLRTTWTHTPEDIDAEWRAIPGFSQYDASADGHLRRARSLFPLSASCDDRGRFHVTIIDDSGKQRTKMVHSLVAAAFYGPRPDGLVICHNNGDHQDNRISNLRYDTQAENIEDAIRQGRNKRVNRTHCRRDHEYTAENTYLRPGAHGRTTRVCLTCKRRNENAAYYRRKAARRLLDDGSVLPVGEVK